MHQFCYCQFIVYLMYNKETLRQRIGNKNEALVHVQTGKESGGWQSGDFNRPLIV